jgi:tripartite-type tricarboxylate transporter receptor subunit TctC
LLFLLLTRGARVPHCAVNAALADPKIKGRLENLGSPVLMMSPAEFRKLIAEETERWAKVLKFANIRPE